MVAIPRRQVEPGLESRRPAGIGELADDVAPASPERARCDRVRRGGRRPEAEAVVMLGGEDHGPEACRLGRARPLPRVEAGRGKDRRVFLAVAPFTVGEGVDAEVQEHRQLIALPFELRGRRHRAAHQPGCFGEPGQADEASGGHHGDEIAAREAGGGVGHAVRVRVDDDCAARFGVPGEDSERPPLVPRRPGTHLLCITSQSAPP